MRWENLTEHKTKFLIYLYAIKYLRQLDPTGDLQL